MTTSDATQRANQYFLGRFVESAGELAADTLTHVGSVTRLALDVIVLIASSLIPGGARIGKAAIVSQIVRVGVRSVGIVSLVSACVGLILAFQLAPPLDDFGKRDLIANIIGIAVARELGPLIGAIVLTGFAGASIAAEIGTMVVSEEIEALEAHALDPVRFLVVPRVIAAVISMTVLASLAIFMALAASAAGGVVSVTRVLPSFIRCPSGSVRSSDGMMAFMASSNTPGFSGPTGCVGSVPLLIANLPSVSETGAGARSFIALPEESGLKTWALANSGSSCQLIFTSRSLLMRSGRTASFIGPSNFILGDSTAISASIV